MTTTAAPKPKASASSVAKPKRPPTISEAKTNVSPSGAKPKAARKTTAVPPRPKGVASSAGKPKTGRKTVLVSEPKSTTSAADSLRQDQRHTDPHVARVLANTLAGGHDAHDAHPVVASGNPLGGDHQTSEAHGSRVAAELLFCAEFLDDVERIRIATENRLRALDEAGYGDAAASYEDQLLAFVKLEHEATLALRRVVRRHPLGPWIKATRGVGEKQGARLLAALGDATYNHAEGRPRRGPAELWAYCGYAPGQKRKKGVKSNWNATAKMRAFLISEAMLKAGNREHYDRARANWADRDVKDGHKHNHALRVQAKEMLKDLFLTAREMTT